VELMNLMVDFAKNGLGASDVGLLLARGAAGSFFALSGYNKLFNKGRHETIVETLKADKVPCVPFMQWWVPGWEFVGGMMLLAGVFPAFAAMVLSVILFVACCAEAKGRVEAYKPINAGDRVDDYLYLPEVIYLVPLFVVVMCGGGKFSVMNLF
jgi:putative oxidoreductase